MFKCDLCGAISKPKQPCSRIVVAARMKEYPARGKRDSGRGYGRRDDLPLDPGGQGWEAKQEANVIGCEECTGNGQPCPGKLKR